MFMEEYNDMFYLLPYEKEDVFHMQDVGQNMGWQVMAFNIPEVWKITKGAGVTVAVIDSGVDLEHPDLKSSIIAGKNFVEVDQPPFDSGEHGTHCAGIIAATNNDFGVVGVAPEAKIMPIKVLNSFGSGKMEWVVDAIKFAVDNGADIISMSLGCRNPVDKVLEQIKYANSHNVVCFVAAGNAGSTKQLLYPAAYTECISIGAVDEKSMRADFSCTGPNLDFVAPGVKIFSTVPVSSYAYLSGTSMACPFAVGVAALVLSERRQQDPNAKLTIADYRQILSSNTISIKNLDANLDKNGAKFWQGMGIINPSEFENWVEYRNANAIKRELVVVNDKISMLKKKTVLADIKSQLDAMSSKIII
jgi:major intracellular serine protease